jgi:hypothetical protein
MSDVGKSLSVRVMEALKDILPAKAGFVLVVGIMGEEEIGITSNLPDDIALEFLEESIISINTEPAVDLAQEAKLNSN